MNKPPVVFVNALKGRWGGVETYVARTARLLRENGWRTFGLFEREGEGAADFDPLFEASAILGTPEAEALTARVSAEGAVAFAHKVGRTETLALLGAAMPLLVLVHDHDYYCLRRHKYYSWNRRNCGRPFRPLFCAVCSGLVERRNGKFRPVRPSQTGAMLRAVKAADRLLVLSEHMRGNLLMNGVAPDKIRKVPPFVITTGTPVPPPEHPEGVRILFVGQIIRGKGLDLLVRALAAVPGRWNLHIAGRGNDEEFVRSLAASLGLADRLVWRGFVTDPAALYKDADVVAVPSRWQEPFGLVGIEAFAQGRPAAAFAVGGIGEWLQSGRNGLTAPDGEFAALGARLAELVADAALRRRLGEAGYQTAVTSFTPAAFLSAFQSALEGLRG